MKTVSEVAAQVAEHERQHILWNFITAKPKRPQKLVGFPVPSRWLELKQFLEFQEVIDPDVWMNWFCNRGQKALWFWEV